MQLKTALSIIIAYNLLSWFLFSWVSRPFERLSCEQNIPFLLEEFPRGESQTIAKNFNDLNHKLNTFSHETQESHLTSQEILESIGDGVVALNAEENVLFMNKAAIRFLKVYQESPQMHRFFQLQTGRKALFFRCHEMIQYVFQTSEPSFQTWHEEGEIHLDLIAKPRQERRGVLLVIQDKTSHYKVLEMDKDFIANASHELRTPITIIRGFAETLRDHPKLTAHALSDISEKIVRTSERLEKLIQSLLMLADIENFSKYKFQTTDLVALAEQCKNLVLTIHPMVHLTFTAEPNSIFVLAVPQLLDLAIMNLLENAVKYSPSPSQIHLTIQVVNHDVCLEVRDLGIGIPESDLPYIFDRFYIVDKARSRKSGGTGLGLSLVKTIVEKHKGTISVASRLGAGSTFTIALPLKSGVSEKM
ncbi:MAG: GHKL domain-containing protein [Chlamydiae bacterium]|nr:GHKL domain-containing protein [Chlamydiota bacterium]